MAFEPVANTVEVKMFAERDGNTRLNVIHYMHAGGDVSEAQLLDLCNYVNGQIIAQGVKNTSAIGTTWTSVLATDISKPDGLQVGIGSGVQSAGGTQVLPANVSLVLSKRSNFAGRSKRGRFYLFDLPEDWFNGSTFNSGLYGNAVNYIIELLETPAGPNGMFQPAIASKTLGTSVPWVRTIINTIAATQRRRLPGRGS